MLVYANALKLEGSDAFNVAGRAIHGWLAEQLGERNPRYGDLFKRGEWKSDEARRAAWLRSYAATDGCTDMYAWVLKHADDRIHGRQWLVELGLKCEDDMVEFSCTIQTEELSVQVTSPVTASRPRLVKYVLRNVKDETEARLAADVPGKTLRSVGADVDSYRALLATIEDNSRDHPLVMVSPDRDGVYPLNPRHLQESLLGLAQVVKVDAGYNSYDMEEVLGRHYSAWDGAINLIQTLNRRGFCRGHVFRSDEVDTWGETSTARVIGVLGHVTHSTNVPRLRRRIRADSVVRFAMRQRMDEQRQSLRKDSGSEQAMIDLLEEGVGELTEQNENLQQRLDESEVQRLQLLEHNDELEHDLRAERYSNRVRLREQTAEQKAVTDLTLLLDLAGRPSQPTPEECLKVIALAYPERVEVLDSAFDAAAKHSHFEQGRRFLKLLCRLCTDFIEGMVDGGDEQARKVFTDKEYAANESESTQNNKAMRQARTFQHHGQPVEMWRHLKIGVADDQRKSIRVYFEWLAHEKKIVIGHCGAHLPVTSH